MYFWPDMFNSNVWFFLLIFQLLAKTLTIHKVAFGEQAIAILGALSVLFWLELVNLLSNAAYSWSRQRSCGPKKKKKKKQNLLLHEDGQNLNQIKVPWLNANTFCLRIMWAHSLFSLLLNSKIIAELNQGLKKGSLKFLGLWLSVPVSDVLGDSL